MFFANKPQLPFEDFLSSIYQNLKFLLKLLQDGSFHKWENNENHKCLYYKRSILLFEFSMDLWFQLMWNLRQAFNKGGCYGFVVACLLVFKPFSMFLWTIKTVVVISTYILLINQRLYFKSLFGLLTTFWTKARKTLN